MATANVPLFGPAPSTSQVAAAAASSAASASSSSTSRAVYSPSLPRPFPHAKYSPLNILQQLIGRQSHAGPLTQAAFRRSTNPHRYGRMKMQTELDTRVTSTRPMNMEPLIRLKSSKVDVISEAEDVILVLTDAGVCLAYDCVSFRLLCTLNVVQDERIRGVFHNQVDRSIIISSLCPQDNFSALQCRTTPLTAIRLGEPELCVSLFTSESFEWPGFLDFDGVNQKILTFSSSTRAYKVWQLSDYSLQFQIGADRGIDDVKPGPGVLLLIHCRHQHSVPIEIVDIETGAALSDFTYELSDAEEVLSMELLGEMLVIKKSKCPLQLLDVTNPCKRITLPHPVLSGGPLVSIYMQERPLFLTFTRRKIDLWSFQGRRMANFEGHFNWFPDGRKSCTSFSREQDCLILYCLSERQVESMKRCRRDPSHWRQERTRTGEIRMLHALSGRCIANIRKLKKKKYPFDMLSPQQQQRILEQSASRSQGSTRRHATVRQQPNHSSDAMQASAELFFGNLAALVPTAAAVPSGLLPTHGDEAAAIFPVDRVAFSPTFQLTEYFLRLQRHLQMQLLRAQYALRLTEISTGRNSIAADGTPFLFPAVLAAPAQSDLMDLGDEGRSVDRSDENEEEGDSEKGDEEGEEQEETVIDEDTDEATEPEDEALELLQRELRRGQQQQCGQTAASEPIDDLSLHTVSFTASKSSGAGSSPRSERARSSLAARSPSHMLAPHWDFRTLSDYRSFNLYVQRHNRALKNITAIFYSEERNELYTGNQKGRVHVWRSHE